MEKILSPPRLYVNFKPVESAYLSSSSNAGMSTSYLVKKMQKAAKDQGLEAEIKAVSVTEAPSYIDSIDVMLLGPQIRFELPKMKEKIAGRIPVDVIDMRDYGAVNGQKVLKHALDMIEASK